MNEEQADSLSGVDTKNQGIEVLTRILQED